MVQSRGTVECVRTFHRENLSLGDVLMMFVEKPFGDVSRDSFGRGETPLAWKEREIFYMVRRLLWKTDTTNRTAK